MRRRLYLHPQRLFTFTENTSNNLTNYMPTQNFTRIFRTSRTLTVENLRWWLSTISCRRPTRRSPTCLRKVRTPETSASSSSPKNLFPENKFARTISLNAHYMVLFNNPRDVSQFANLARQRYPKTSQVAVEAYRDATRKSYSYLLVDLPSEQDEELRLKTNIFPGESLRSKTAREDIKGNASVDKFSVRRSIEQRWVVEWNVSARSQAHTKNGRQSATRIC